MINELITTCKIKEPLPVSVVLYGSYHHGSWISKSSDIDLICISESVGMRSHEVDFVGGEEVHIAYVGKDIIRNDANSASYGYLYISKFLNPHKFIEDSGSFEEEITMLLFNFLERYAFSEIFDGPLSLDQIIARTLLIHIQNFPHYSLKLIKILHTDKNSHSLSPFYVLFQKILNEDNFYLVSNNLYQYKGEIRPHFERLLFHERVRMAWWQTYFNYRRNENFFINHLKKIETEEKIRSKEIVQLLRFLNQMSGH